MYDFNIHVRLTGGVKNTGVLTFGRKHIKCTLGKGGITANKREGDGATPLGTHKILYGFYREDRIRLPVTKIPMMPIRPELGWCDDPVSPCYNQLITLPTRWRHEKLWRTDHLYDVCIVLDYNINPSRKNRGSAIFFHLSHPEHKPTEGCIAIDQDQMRKILMQIDHETRIIIHR